MSAYRYATLLAIAKSLLDAYARDDDDRDAGATDYLHSAIHWSPKAVELIGAGYGDSDDNNLYAEQNQVGDEKSLAIGFRVGLQIGALIARAPLDETDVDVREIVSRAAEEHLVELIARRMERARAPRSRRNEVTR